MLPVNLFAGPNCLMGKGVSWPGGATQISLHMSPSGIYCCWKVKNQFESFRHNYPIRQRYNLINFRLQNIMVISQVGHLISGWVPLIRGHIKDQVHNNISICTEAATIIITIICSNWRRLVYISEGLPVPGEAEQSWRRPGIWFVGILFPSIMSTLAGLFRWSSHKCRLIKRVTITDSPKSVIGNFPAQSSPLWIS